MAEAPLSRRPSPILLVVPIILTVAGLGLSVWQYLRHHDKTEGTLVKEQTEQRRLNEEVQKRDAVLARLLALRAILGYEGEDFQAWLDKRLQKGGHADFKRAMAARQAEITNLQGRVDALLTEINTTTDQIASVQQAKQQMDAAKRAEAEQKLNEEAAVDRTFAQRTTDLLERINEAGKTLMEKEAERVRVDRERAETKKRQDDTLIAIQLEVERMEDALDEQRSLAQQVDGQIVSVERGSDQVTIDLGRRHRVRPGLRFKVVEKGQAAPDPNKPQSPLVIPRTAVVKGEIEILRVFEQQSLAVVLNLDFSKPVMPGDAIFNPAYDPAYKTRFVVVGRIDLNGDGAHDGELVEELIGDVGGVIETEVNVSTDFLLVGADWPTEEPALRSRYYRDQEQVKAAEDLGVSFLNVRRFLDYVGVRVGRDGVVAPMETGV